MAESVDTLLFWHPRQDQRSPDDWFAWGTVARGSSADKIFRVKNASVRYTALGVVVSLQHLNLYDPLIRVDHQHYLSLDGRSFAATVNVGDLPPGATSAVVILRRVTARDADEGPGEFQLSAQASDWT